MSEATDNQDVTETTPYISRITEGESTSLAVIDAVAAVSGRPPMSDGSTNQHSKNDALEPLGEVIDPDALNTLCPTEDDDPQEATTVTFTYCGYEVTTKSTGQVVIEINK